jgi:tetratricopeptide (TPR) repeat protein
MAQFDKGERDEGIASLRKAIAIDPKLARAHNNLGRALMEKGEGDEAIACYRKAIEIAPRYAEAHTNLGVALAAKREVEEAIASHRKAIEIAPGYADAHANLGRAMAKKGAVDEAIASYRKAIACDPRLAAAHFCLGLALTVKGEVEEAIACYRKTLAIDPTFARAHTNLGNALGAKGEADEAIACYRKAIACDPKLPQAHSNLGDALMAQGQLNGARDAFVRTLELLPNNHPRREETIKELQRCARLLKLEERLPRILRGEDKAGSVGEDLDLARLCHVKQMHAAAARFFASAFAADPRLAEDLNAGDRYNAACYAALAAAGKGEDAARLDDKERAGLRQRALDWLRADLTLWRGAVRQGGSGQAAAARAALRHWQKDPDLAGVRATEELKMLPAAEQQAWRGLWAEVQELLAGAPDTPPRP